MKHLIIGSGGMMIYMFIGAIHNLLQLGMLDDVQEISCASCGSLIGFFFVLLFGDMEKITQIAFNQDMKQFAKPDIKTFLKRFGFMDTSVIEKDIIKSAGCDPTFRELYEMNPIKLHISAYELLTGRTIYMSVDTTPDMKVTRAIRMSISLPILFTPCRENGQLFIDGSTIEPSPYVPFLGKNDVIELRWRKNPTEHRMPKSALEFIKVFIASFFESFRIGHQYIDYPRIDLVSNDDSVAYDWLMTNDIKTKLFEEGYEQVLKYYAT